jgi:hypothetical protein
LQKPGLPGAPSRDVVDLEGVVGPNRPAVRCSAAMRLLSGENRTLGLERLLDEARAVRDSPDRHVRNSQHVAISYSDLPGLPHLDRVLSLGRAAFGPNRAQSADIGPRPANAILSGNLGEPVMSAIGGRPENISSL